MFSRGVPPAENNTTPAELNHFNRCNRGRTPDVKLSHLPPHNCRQLHAILPSLIKHFDPTCTSQLPTPIDSTIHSFDDPFRQQLPTTDHPRNPVQNLLR